jgi:sigma-E factor negative regulatory protein RseA
MNDRLSALMDGELDDKSAAEVIEALARDGEAVETWRTYQVISDAVRGDRLLSVDFSARLAARLAAEPTVLAPRALPPAEPRRWYAASAVAASVAAVALVGWLAFAPQPAQSPQLAETPAAQPQLAQDVTPTMVPLPSAASDYLLAHQGFSPRVSIQGMAPYVRTVSEQTVEPRR